MKLTQLHEAKYAGRYSNEDVYRQYNRKVNSKYEEYWDDMETEVPVLDVIDIIKKDTNKVYDSEHTPWEGKDYVSAIFYTDTPINATRDHVISLIKQYHVDHNIPFGEINKLTSDEPYELYGNSIVWTAFVRYYGY
ncbi:hypothetical protein LCGC14_2573190 [marine sediment metagenome]|uniref:Uncharacterized protein n=1 Tax=marine sediment metagenome TaxID=412755 RepID=A0A0F9AGQ0_9ZZZZ